MTAATQVLQFTVTIPSGTPQIAPFTQDCSFPPMSVVGIRWRVPPGPSGTMGFQITSDGAGVIPAGAANYIVADNEADDVSIAGYQDSGSWQVTGYNVDSYPHSVYVTFYLVQPGQDQPPAGGPAPPPAQLPNSALSPPPPNAADFIAGLQVPT